MQKSLAEFPLQIATLPTKKPSSRDPTTATEVEMPKNFSSKSFYGFTSWGNFPRRRKVLGRWEPWQTIVDGLADEKK